MKWIMHILQSFEFRGVGDFVKSLFPALKYEHLSILTVGFSGLGLFVDKLFGMTWMAFLMLLVVLVTELVSGIWASKIDGQQFSSKRLSRFSFKSACYLILIAAPYVLSVSFAQHDQTMASHVFSWMYVFLVIQIVFEMAVSILENLGIISGKGKTYWIKKLQEKAKSIL